MKKIILGIIAICIAVALSLSYCNKNGKNLGNLASANKTTQSVDASKSKDATQDASQNAENKGNTAQVEQANGTGSDKVSEKVNVTSGTPGFIPIKEEDFQSGIGINGKLNSFDYSYEGLKNYVVGTYPPPLPSEPNYETKLKEWKTNVATQLKTIEKKLPEDASKEEVNNLFNQLLYIGGFPYEQVESLNHMPYVVFKNDGVNPFTNEAIIDEERNVNVEIVLDASGSMAKRINGTSMMDIAKNSISSVLNALPKNAKVGLRVFGHKGNNKEDGKAVSCDANELIVAIDKLDNAKIDNALKNIKPTGWTSIAKSIDNAYEDLSKFNDKKDLNILYIITDGLETCDGDPIASAKKIKR